LQANAARKLRRCCCRLRLFELRRRACGSKEGALRRSLFTGLKAGAFTAALLRSA
jgi:hypothetical protein